MPEEKPLTVEEVAENLRVNPDTVRAWIRSGELDAINIGGSTASIRVTWKIS